MPTSAARNPYDTALPPIPVDPEIADLKHLRRTWRAAAMRQWLRGPRLLALLLGVCGLPAMWHYGHSNGLSDLYSRLAWALSISFAAPLLTAILTLIALDGPWGIARFDDLRTLPGGPTEWGRALSSTARNLSFAAMSIWAVVAGTVEPSYHLSSIGESAFVFFPAAWAVSHIVVAIKLTVKVPVVSAAMIWGFALWPAYRVFDTAMTPSTCGNPLIGALEGACVIGYGLQGLIAASISRAALARLSAPG